MVKRGEPLIREWLRARDPEWTPLLHQHTHRMRIARAASHFGIGADRQPWLCARSSDTARYRRSSGAAKAAKALARRTGKRLIHMGDWRDTHRSQ